MQLLFDENMSPATAGIFSLLGHPSLWVGDLDLLGTPDEDLAALLAGYDAFVTFDLHRQRSERHAINQAIIDGANVIRLRIRGNEPDDVMSQVRMLIVPWARIENALQNRPDLGLLTITDQGLRVRETNRVTVAAWPS